MALTIEQPTDGQLPLAVRVNAMRGGALVATPIPSGVTVSQPTDGTLPILGAAVVGQIVGGAFVQSLP